jgi:GGDEF domain-containing protein
MSAWRQTTANRAAGVAERRALGLLLEGATINLPQVDLALYQRFRSAILRNSIALTKPQTEEDLLHTVTMIVKEFDVYRTENEMAIEGQQKSWRFMTSMLMHLLAARDGIDMNLEGWIGIEKDLASATTEEEILTLRTMLQKLLDKQAPGTVWRSSSDEEKPDRSVNNDNAAGLPGGGAAIEHVRTMLSSSRPGYVGIFRLNCLDVVGERFGPEGIQDCLMAVSAFLIQNLRREDTIYHWSESSLLAVCDRQVREEIVVAELNRVLARNRDFTLHLGNRPVMLRIPVDLSLYPLSYFSTADDLLNLPAGRSRDERVLAGRVSFH